MQWLEHKRPPPLFGLLCAIAHVVDQLRVAIGSPRSLGTLRYKQYSRSADTASPNGASTENPSSKRANTGPARCTSR